MSYSEAMKYDTEVEKGVEMEIYRREMEQQQYEEEMEELKEEILDSFHSFKERHFNKFIGKTIEFQFQLLSKYGVPRHAFGVKIRED